MRNRQYERKKPQFFHQKGWIATNFTVKNNVSAILKTRQKNHTEVPRVEYHGATPIHRQPTSPFHRQPSSPVQQYRSSEHARASKPSSAPVKARRERMSSATQSGSGVGYWYDELLAGELRHSNFKTTLNARKPLLFLRPYARNTSANTIDQRKAQLYQEINNPDLATFNLAFNQTGPIQYLTEYTEPAGGVPNKEVRSTARQRNSMNVLREKLKRRCEMSYYQSKINMFKQA